MESWAGPGNEAIFADNVTKIKEREGGRRGGLERKGGREEGVWRGRE